MVKYSSKTFKIVTTSIQPQLNSKVGFENDFTPPPTTTTTTTTHHHKLNVINISAVLDLILTKL